MSAASLKRKATELASAAKKSKADKSITSFFSAPSTSASKKKNLSESDALIALAEGDSTDVSVPKSQAPPPLDNTTSAALPKFDKEKWVAKLTPEQKELLNLEIETLHESWLAQLKDEVVTKEFLDLKRFLKAEKEAGQKVFPPEKEIYSWSQHTPLNTVKVVILGQDPYHNDRQAHGLCFSVRPPTPAPQSLANVYKALANDYPTFKPPPKRGGLLTPWADRGVLLLNTCLTVRAHLANSHSKKGWEKFTQKVIDIVNKKRTRGVVFLAWGSPALGRMKGINKERHCVLSSVHPSPLSAHKGFFDCGHFKKTNEWLKQRYGPGGEIDWDLNVAQKETERDHQVVATPKAPPPTPADDGGDVV